MSGPSSSSTSEAEDQSNVAGVLSAMGIKGGPLQKVAGTLVVGSSLIQKAKWARNEIRARTAWSIVVADGDRMYHPIHRWLLSQVPPEKRRTVTAFSTVEAASLNVASSSDVPEPDIDRSLPGRLGYRFEGSREQTVRMDGYRITVAIEREEATQYSSRSESIRFTAHSSDGRAAIERFLDRIATGLVAGERTPQLYMATRWGEWRQRSDLPRRRLDTVCLPAGQLDGLMGDLRAFLANERRYADLGVPWHRGYLLWGPPGGGKTSVVRAAATELGLDCYFLPLSDVKTDSQIYDMVAQCRGRSLLLLEDVDVLAATHARKSDDGDGGGEGVTLAGLLNMLDGVATPHGLIVVMTTNRREVFDDALLRPGRVDYEVEIGPLVREQLDGLWSIAFPSRPPRTALDGIEVPVGAVSAADVVGVLKANINDPVAASIALHGLMAEKAKKADSTK